METQKKRLIQLVKNAIPSNNIPTTYIDGNQNMIGNNNIVLCITASEPPANVTNKKTPHEKRDNLSIIR